MAESDKSLAVRVQAHLRAAAKRVPAMPDIIPLLATAREEVARAIARNRDRRQELRVTPPFTLTVADGEADIATLLAEPYRLLEEFLPEADVRDDQDRKLYYVGSDRYNMEQPSGYGYFTLQGTLLSARMVGEDPETSDFEGTISGNFVPTADELPASVVPDVVVFAAALCAGLPAEGEE